MLRESFHNHTWRCNHAENTERDYIESAVRGGMTKLGFSDHGPYVFENGYYSGFRMKPEQIQGYFDTLEALKQEYKDKIDIYIGFEAEYYPKFFGKFLKLIADYPVEYLLMGQHFIHNEMDRMDSFHASESVEKLQTYVRQVAEGLSTGKFACLAHPDVLWFTGSKDIYQKEMLIVCEAAKKYNVLLEINLLGVRDGRVYPNPDFWEVAGQVGNTVTIGSDAHRAADVYDPKSYETAMGIVKRFGLNCVNAGEMIKGGHWLG